MRELAAITFRQDGTGHCLYHETIDLRTLGRLTCTRASHVEFDAANQQWQVRRPGDAAVLFSSTRRAECLQWERANLDRPNT